MHDIGHKGGLMVTPQGALHPGGHIKSHALRIFLQAITNLQILQVGSLHENFNTHTSNNLAYIVVREQS